MFSPETKRPQDALPGELRGEAYAISCYQAETRWSFLDRVGERLATEGAGFLENPVDKDTIEWGRRLKAIRRDVHKAHAFVRFKKIAAEGKEVFTAWHRPQHDTLDLFVRLFCRRFPVMNWVIVTSEESAHHDQGELRFGPGHQGQFLEVEDDWENYWRTYYASIHNPARLMVQAMKKEMPVWHWQTLPETRLIPGLIREGAARLEAMARKAQNSAAGFIPRNCSSLEEIGQALPLCQGCRLHSHCSPTAGKGNPKAPLVLVGEQPGDEEEKAGELFIGPAGQLLRQIAREGEVPLKDVYLTNAVKHFKYEQRGPLRLHKRPERDEVAACRPWLQMELSLVRPKIVLCLGSTAALSVTGRLWPVERYRGTWLPMGGDTRVLLTYHPAAILRAPPEKSGRYYRELLDDLKLASSP